MSKILVIDDSRDLLSLQKMLLELEGHEVFTASSGKKAFEVLDAIGEPDLILLDMQMPEMSGQQFMASLDAKTPEVQDRYPIVIMTAQETPPESRAIGFINKMVSSDEFIEKVEHYLCARGSRVH